MGGAGLYTLGARHYKERDQKKFKKMINKLMDAYELCFDEENAEDEVLYGNSGYIYCLLSVMHYCWHSENMTYTIRKVIDEIIRVGKKWSKSNEYFIVKWPRNRDSDKFYLGGAHGLFGAL